MVHDILVISDRKEELFLHKRTHPWHTGEHGMLVVDRIAFTRQELDALLRDMKKKMRRAHGVGLSANQIGLPYRLFVAEIPDPHGNPKFYAVFNPEIEKTGGEKIPREEGCLSVPGVYGEVPRYERVTLRGMDKRGKPLRIKAWGFLAHVFQHETDHLDGTVFIDKARNLHEAPTKE